jgi:tetratricopeptide (TPR) repeat protein
LLAAAVAGPDQSVRILRVRFAGVIAPAKRVQISAGGVLSAGTRQRRMLLRLNRTSVGILVALAMSLALGQRATAAGLDKKGSAAARKATQHYKQGNYEEAATIFLQLSVDNPDMPVFVRNLGACYYYLRRPEPALSNLREYLHKKKDITPDDSAEVERWIAEMDQLRQRESTTTPAAGPVPFASPAVPTARPSTAPVTPWPPAAGQAVPAATPEMPPANTGVPGAPPQSPGGYSPHPAPPAQGPPGAIAQVPPPAESGGSGGRKVAAWVLGGVGVAALAAGGVFTGLALKDFSDIEKKYDRGKESQGKTYATLQWVGYGVGGAAVVTAVILLATGRDAPKSVALAPTVGPGIAGAVLSGSF